MTHKHQEHSESRFEKLYTMLLENIPSSVLLIDRNARVTGANRNYLVKSRRTLEGTVGQKLADVFPVIILQQLKIFEQLEEVFSTGLATPGQRMYYRAPRVPLRYYYYRLTPFLCDGLVEFAILFMDDITEQVQLGNEMQRLQTHLALVIESASEMVLSTDTEGQILSWNQAAEKISSYALHEVVNHHFADFFAHPDRDNVSQMIANTRAEGPPYTAEWKLLSKDGDLIEASWICSSMQDEEGKSIGIVAVGRDLRQQRLLEQQLQQSEKLASLGVMAGGIAHEIRNPLAICSSAAQFLQDKTITEDFREGCAEKIHHNINKATEIIENLLRFSRLETGFDKELVVLNALFQEARLLVSNQAKINKVKFVTDLPDRMARVEGSTSLLLQVIINLLLNGIQAMPKGGLLQLRLAIDSKEVAISIQDSGIGIPSANIDKIFDPFFTTAPVGKGTGLGLSLSYSIIEMHKGHITVQSTEGQGTTFTVTLPSFS